ncbi:hypothetical protein DSO57_1031190 [Entomophthora muscae]|uniref:Uncharacterized protein n=1 Tax=Entomophthora muscae TaxID=34485 RepID=A0ACC2TZC3_9FUNG|nr:hypothetical protein DSO57_1031190 [Entomophthora muscae]
MGGSSSDDNKKGDQKFRLGGGGGKTKGSLFADYLSQTASANVDSSLPETMKASTLLELIASERNWSTSLLDQDLTILERNRLYTVADLRILSKESWKALELLPIVKDLLRNKISFKGKNKNKKKKKYSSSSSSSNDEPKETIEYDLGSSKVAGANALSKPANGTIVAMGSKIRVASQSGKVYEASRYCPHKGVDLSKGWVSGDSVICPKHKWAFNLSLGGSCTSKAGYSVNACEINDW